MTVGLRNEAKRPAREVLGFLRQPNLRAANWRELSADLAGGKRPHRSGPPAQQGVADEPGETDQQGQQEREDAPTNQYPQGLAQAVGLG